MGDGKKLKAVLDRKGKNVRWIAKKTAISPTTLYSIIQRDTDIRLDFALRIARVLEIDVSEICSDKYLSEKTFINDEIAVKADTEKIIEHLSNYYQLTDDGRRDVDDFIKALLVAEARCDKLTK